MMTGSSTSTIGSTSIHGVNTSNRRWARGICPIATRKASPGCAIPIWAVDTAGNQLPYIDNLTMSYFSQSEVAILSMMQGSVDLGGRLPDPADFALYKENESIGDYTLREWQDLKTARIIYMFNLNHEDPAKRQVFLDKRFRHAMSLAINREEINEFAFNGLATPQQFTVAAGTEFYDPAWARAFADYDPARAKAMLDEIGLRDTDGDGVREGPDGNPFALSMSTSSSSVIGPMGFNISLTEI